jgi:hypothetical protein
MLTLLLLVCLLCPVSRLLSSADVIVIGAGPAGLQAVETLTKAASGLRDRHGHILRITHLEAQNRIGGRVHTKRICRVKDTPMCIERGAAFIHGVSDSNGHAGHGSTELVNLSPDRCPFDPRFFCLQCDPCGGNRAFNIAVRHNLLRKLKSDVSHSCVLDQDRILLR